jgi:hypothetical protein
MAKFEFGFSEELINGGILHCSKIRPQCPSWVICTHYRAAALLSASPRSADPDRTGSMRRYLPILLQKSFSTADHNFF